jgi:hypothetical protein
VDLCAQITETETPKRQIPHEVRHEVFRAKTVSRYPVHGKSPRRVTPGGREVTNTVMRWRAKDRRQQPGLPPEHAFSVTGLGIAILTVVVAVMFSV